METTLLRPAFVAAKITPKAMAIVYSIVTAIVPSRSSSACR